MQRQPDLTIVVPFLNEEENITRVFEALVSALDPVVESFEMLFIDDGSTDTTLEIAKKLASADSRLRVISFRRNYGQTPAMAAGIDHARGRVIVTMDGDLQNDPRDIPMLLKKINEGYDIVVGWRHKRQDKLITRKIPSIIANRLIGKVTGIPIKDNGCSLKAYKADVIQGIPLYADMHRFIPAMTSLAGAKIAEVKVRHHARTAGDSKYGLSRIYKVLMDLVTIKTLVGFYSKPLTWFSILAIPFAMLGIVILGIGIVDLVSNGSLSTSLTGTGLLFMILALFLFFDGILAELIYTTGDTRPKDFVRIRVQEATGSPVEQSTQDQQ